MRQDLLIAYCRASSRAQQLGLAMQQATIEAHATTIGRSISAWYEDVGPASPTARNFARWQPALAAAITACRTHGATLVVARLDRLTRSTALLSTLLEEGPPLCIAETPQASRLMLHLYAAIAEEHRLRMSRRVRAGIEAAKRAGRKRNPHARAVADRLRSQARARAAALRPIIEEIRRGRALTVQNVADELNRHGLRTASGALWGYRTTFVLWHRFHRRWHTRGFRGRPGATDSWVKAERALTHAEELRERVEQYRNEGLMTSDVIAACLNRDGIRTITGRLWRKKMTCRLLRRLDGKPV